MLRDQVARICNTMPTILFQVWGWIKVLRVSCLRQLGQWKCKVKGKTILPGFCFRVSTLLILETQRRWLKGLYYCVKEACSHINQKSKCDAKVAILDALRWDFVLWHILKETGRLLSPSPPSLLHPLPSRRLVYLASWAFSRAENLLLRRRNMP